jgi:Tetratricopeptide repeat
MRGQSPDYPTKSGRRLCNHGHRRVHATLGPVRHRALAKRPRARKRLNNLGILDRAQNRPAEARKAFEEAMKIYEAFAKQDPDQFSPLV